MVDMNKNKIFPCVYNMFYHIATFTHCLGFKRREENAYTKMDGKTYIRCLGVNCAV